MKYPVTKLACPIIIASLLACSGSQYEEDLLPEKTYAPYKPDTSNIWVDYVSLKDLGYANTSNATLVVKQVDTYEGDPSTAYLSEAFLGLGLPDSSIETSDRTRILINPTRDAQIYVLYPNNNFTILGYNGVKVPGLTHNVPVLGQNYVTMVRMSYDINTAQMILLGGFSAFTSCPLSDDRNARLYFEGVFSEEKNGYEGKFTWTETEGENEVCQIICTGILEVLLD